MITIDRIILFVDSLLRKYEKELNPQAYAEYVAKLKKIKDKNVDEKLYLSVIGEFSTGKSTFINALLRDNLLDAQVLQGTTTINSVIQYGNELNMIIQMLNNVESDNLKLRGYSDEAIRARIKNIHAGEGTHSIKKVTITHPSEFLSQGIVIIDTPGTNTPELWHEQVTRNAIHELSDTSIILTSANQPVPDSLVDFVEGNLQGVLDRCIFLVTKIDTIRQREREEQIEYIRYSIQQKLGIKEPIVLPYSSLLVLEEKTDMPNAYSKNDRDDILSMSFESDNKIFEYICANKQAILKAKLSKLLVELLNELERDLDAKNEAYQQRNSILKANTKKDLDTFLNDNACETYVQKHIEEVQQLIDASINSLIEILKEDIITLHQELFGCANETALKNYINYVNNAIAFRTNESNKLLGNVNSEFVTKANLFVEGFVSLLNKEYSGLNALLTNDDRKEIPIGKITNSDLPKFEIPALNTDTNIKIGGGALAGAAIGTAILPGIGTALGALAGGFFGSLFGPDLNTLKSQVWNEIYPKIVEQYDKLSKIVGEKIIESANKIDEQSYNRIDAYVERYKGKIIYLVEQDRREREDLERRKATIKEDKEKITEYRDFLYNK